MKLQLSEKDLLKVTGGAVLNPFASDAFGIVAGKDYTPAEMNDLANAFFQDPELSTMAATLTGYLQQMNLVSQIQNEFQSAGMEMNNNLKALLGLQ